MPIYTYQCNKCGTTKKQIRNFEDRESPLICQCGSSMLYLLPSTANQKVKRIIDPYRNVSVKDGVEEDVRKRAKEHFIERGEMDDLIEKHGLEHAKRSGWIKKDGKKITKSDLK